MNVTQDGVPLVEKKLKTLYTTVGKLNTLIRELNEQNVEINAQIRNLQNRQKVLALQCAGAQERVASAQGDLDRADEVSEADREILQSRISRWRAEMAQWENELIRVEAQLEIAKFKFESNNKSIQLYQDGQWEIDGRTYYGKEKLIHDFEAEFLPYIKEGVWLDSSYVDNDTYFLDAQKVLMTSSKPKLEWTIEVVDGSMATELENFEFEVGDKTILVDNEFFGVEKNGEKNYVFEVLISGIKEGLDNATKNTIEVRNYNTSFEELFERISAATQTLELNEQTYNKSQYFTSDGELDADILQKTLLQNSLILANAADNSYVLDETGLSFQSLLNPNKKVRLLAEGLFLSNETDLKTGAPKWTTGVTAEGISASLLTAGEINTANIKIFSDAQPSQSWNKLGITSYRVDSDGKVDNTTFIRLDQFGLYLIEGKDADNWHLDGEGNAWFEKLPRRKDAIDQIRENATVSITEAGFDFNYTPEIDERGNEGRIKLGDLEGAFGLLIEQGGKTCVRLDNEGNNEIAGWEIKPGKLCSTGENGKVIVMQSGSSGTWAFAAGGTSHSSYSDCPFRVDHSGNLYATGVDITGKITASSGKIGGFKIGTAGKTVGTDCLSGYTNALSCVIFNNNGFPLYEAGLKGSTEGEHLAFYIKENWYNKVEATYEVRNNFYLKYNGELYARNANIEGKIVAKSGEIGAFVIDSTQFYSKIENSNQSFYISSASHSAVNWIKALNSSNKVTFRVSKDGYLYASGATIEGTLSAKHTNGDLISLDPGDTYDDPLLKFSTTEGYYGGIMMTQKGTALEYRMFYQSPALTFQWIPTFATLDNKGILSLSANKFKFEGWKDTNAYLTIERWINDNNQYFYKLAFCVNGETYYLSLNKS
jgi:hypothetical protein